MRKLLLFLLAMAGFAIAGAMFYYIDPSAVDLAGFGIFYTALLLGIGSLFLLLGLSLLRVSLLTFLILSFILLQQLQLFNLWLGLGLVVVVVIVEQKFTTI